LAVSDTVIGIGTDILQMTRLDYLDEAFLKRAYTDAERAEAAARPEPRLYYATRFAGKEAVFKCFGEVSGEIRWNEIEILSGENGKPFVTLTGACREHANALGITRIHVSLSYDGEYAMGYAIAE
jgi:phosphopantetheine--protein transferase-like protein